MSSLPSGTNNKLHPYDTAADETPFEGFIDFVEVANPVTRDRFINDLRRLHNTTGDLWIPANCIDGSKVHTATEKLITGGLLESITGSRLMNFGLGAHYFTIATLRDDQVELIVDPFGVPTPGRNFIDEPRTITPFFGQVELAPEHHQEVYKLSRQGSRRFIP